MTSLHWTEIVLFKTWSELKTECGRTLGGALWWFVDPLLSILIYYLAFGLILRQGGGDFVPFLCVGIIFWRWFQGSVTRGAASIISEKPLMAKVYMPKLLFPVIGMLADTFKFAIMLLVLLLFLWAAGHPPTSAYWALPPLLLLQLGFNFFAAGLFAALVPFMPDLRNMLNHGLHLLFFLSGIFFSVDSITSPLLRRVILLNPMAGLLSAYRQVLLQNQLPDAPYLLAIAAATALGILIVVLLLLRFDRVYPKIIL